MDANDKTDAFLEKFFIEPTQSGPLDGLTFAVKDLMDVAGMVTGCGNPTWRATHPPATAHAVCVEQLLSAGARCIGKTITDELAFSLLGENHFYGTPLNPKAADRVPGGSSSGSASAVASGHADFALGTDTGGSVRVPASNCGIWGMRTTHGRVSVAGVNPLSPTFDTVGVFASTLDVLSRAASILMAFDLPQKAEPENIYCIREGFELCEPDTRELQLRSMERIKDIWSPRVRWISMREIDAEPQAASLDPWKEIYRLLQWTEAESCLGPWVAANTPDFGPIVKQSFEMIRTVDRSTIGAMIHRREKYCQLMNAFLGERDLLCLPSVPAPAPLKGSIKQRDQSGTGYYSRALALTSIAGTARLPQINIPGADVNGAPVGISLLARTGADQFLLGSAFALSG